MYKLFNPSTYLVITYFPTYLPMYETYFLQNWLPRSNQRFNSFEVHPQLSNNGHPMDGVLVGAGSIVAHFYHNVLTILNLIPYGLPKVFHLHVCSSAKGSSHRFSILVSL
jgi:hypothetical protein